MLVLKRSRILALAICASVALGGCGNNTPSSESAPTSAAGASAGVPSTNVQTSNEGPELIDVEMRLDWLFHGPNIGFIVAEAKGFYQDQGLRVNVESGQGSGTTAQLVANKSAMFGFADGYAVSQTIAQGADIKYVAGIYRSNPNGITTVGETMITEPMDLLGLQIGLPPGSSQAQQWSAFIEGCELDEAEVETVSIDPGAAVPALLEGRIEALAGYVQGYAPAVENAGKQSHSFWFTDCGVTAVSNGIIVHNDTIEGDPDLVDRFVAASIRGFLYARENPDEAAEILLEYSPEFQTEVALREMEISWDTWVPPSTSGQPLGWTAEEDWIAMLEILATSGGVENPPAPDDVFTNEFIPEGDEFVPPQP